MNATPSLLHPESLALLRRLARLVAKRGVPGDLVEAGVYMGGSAAAIVEGLGAGSRTAWLYDSFAGLPETTVEDGAEAAGHVGEYRGVPERVLDALASVGQPPDTVRVRPGWFDDTLSQPGPEAIAFLHVDADWYRSVLLALEAFYDMVSDGGVVVLDDFGWWEGARLALFEFLAARRLAPVVERFGPSQLFWFKGREHNRDYEDFWDDLWGEEPGVTRSPARPPA